MIIPINFTQPVRFKYFVISLNGKWLKQCWNCKLNFFQILNNFIWNYFHKTSKLWQTENKKWQLVKQKKILGSWILPRIFIFIFKQHNINIFIYFNNIIFCILGSVKK